MFTGEFSSPLGDKNRIALPKKLRDASQGEQFMLTRGYEGCVLFLDMPNWEKLLNAVNVKPLLNMSVRDTKRFLLGAATSITLDAQGRFILPESLITYAHIDKTVTFLGVGEWVEIWDTAKWQERLSYLTAQSAEIADRLNS
jgi:MraZ protein